VLEVVEHEQRRPLAQVVDELVACGDRAVRTVNLKLQALGDRRREQVGCRNADERNEVDAVLIPVDPASRGLERQSRLADATRPDERQQAAVGLVEHATDRCQLVAPPHERRTRGWEVPHPRLERFRGGNSTGSPSISS
jgi:hypothetical protein